MRLEVLQEHAVEVGALLALGAGVRWLRVERAMRNARPLPLPLVVPVLAGAVVVGTVVLLAAGVLFGLIFQSVWLGLTLAVIVSIGWLIAYESWRGRTPNDNDPWDDGAQL